MIATGRAIRSQRQSQQGEHRKGKSAFSPFLTGGCLLALSLGDALAALEIIGIIGLSILLECCAADKSRKTIKERLAGVARNPLITTENGIRTETETSPHHYSFQAHENLSENGPLSKQEPLSEHEHLSKSEHLSQYEPYEPFFEYEPIERQSDALDKRLIRFGTLATIGTFLVSGDPSSALSVMLAVACPYATVLASSAALSFALCRAARSHILVKRGICLEMSGKADCFFFDEAEIITIDSPRMVDAVLRWLQKDGVHALYLITGDGGPRGRFIPEDDPDMRRCCAIALSDELSDALSESKICYLNEPGGAGTQKPAGAGNQEPAGGGTQKPAGAEPQKHPGAGTQAPADAETQEPAGDTCQVVVMGYGAADSLRSLHSLPFSKGTIRVALESRSGQSALEAADIVLTDGSLEQLVRLRQLSHKTLRTIEQNHWLAFFINALEITLKLADLLSPLVSGLLHLGLAFGIIGNSSRLLKWEPPGLKE